LSPDPNPSIASPGVALDDGLQDPDGLKTEAAESNNVAKTTILHACGTEIWGVRSGIPTFTHSLLSVPSVVNPISVPGIRCKLVARGSRQ